jgi:UNC80 N-terminal
MRKSVFCIDACILVLARVETDPAPEVFHIKKRNISQTEDIINKNFLFLQTWERVVVQNILHGLSPSLSDAISSIPRWRFIVATLPYVMHCCASTLDTKSRRSIPDHSTTTDHHHVPLGPNSTKLLYTLHWILLDAAGECAPTADSGPDKHSLDPFLFPLTSLQVISLTTSFSTFL